MKKLVTLLLIAAFWTLPLIAQQVVVVKHKAGGGGNTITYVEGPGAVGNGSTDTFTVTVTSTNTHDALFVIMWGQYYVTCSASVPAPSDNKSSSYTNAWFVPVNNSHVCLQLFYALNTTTGITTITDTLGSGVTDGGMIVLHFSSTGAWTALDKSAAMTATTQGSPWASSAVTTTQTNEVLIGQVGMFISTYVSGILNAYAGTGSWTVTALCDGSSSSPCLAASGPTLDGGNGGILGAAYQIVTTTQSNIKNTGTNNGTTNTYANTPGIATFY